MVKNIWTAKKFKYTAGGMKASKKESAKTGLPVRMAGTYKKKGGKKK